MTTVARKKGLLGDEKTVVREKPKTMKEARRSLEGNEGSGEDDEDNGPTRTQGGMTAPWECGRCGVANTDQKRRCGGCLAFFGARAVAGRAPSPKPQWQAGDSAATTR